MLVLDFKHKQMKITVDSKRRSDGENHKHIDNFGEKPLRKRQLG
jgi:hypothetical protein